MKEIKSVKNWNQRYLKLKNRLKFRFYEKKNYDVVTLKKILLEKRDNRKKTENLIIVLYKQWKNLAGITKKMEIVSD